MTTKNDLDPSGTFDPEESGSMPHAEEDTSATELTTVYPAVGKTTETAQALLEAAGDGNAHLVQARDGAFEVPADVAKSAKIPEADSPPAAKRAPAKAAAK